MDGNDSPPRISDDDFALCAIPTTHRRLVDAHRLWHQSLDAYHDPDGFRANLNATLQALRNITFALQSEKSTFADFDSWYGPWQARLAGDEVATWVKASRNLVVKQGELETSSKAVVRVVNWNQVVVAEIDVDPRLPTAMIVASARLATLVPSEYRAPGTEDDAVTIERRWSVPALSGREVLDALAHCYGLLSSLVLDAHLHLQRLSCIAERPSHTNFVSKHHRTGVLACMAVGAELRSCHFSVNGDAILATASSRPSEEADLLRAEARYGGRGDVLTEWEKMDPMLVADKILYRAKRVLQRDKRHARFVFIRDSAGRWHQHSLEVHDRTGKYLAMQMIASLIERVGADALVDVGEVWTVPVEAASGLDGGLPVESVAERGEALHLVVATRDGVRKSYVTPFTRGPFGGIRLSDTAILDDDVPRYLLPVLEVWHRRGITVDGMGNPVRQWWEPDPLDHCYCGGEARFGECCASVIASATGADDLQSQLARHTTDGQWARAEVLAAALVAQYVLWVRRHTAPTRHVADELHRGMTTIDIPALAVALHWLHEASTAAGHESGFDVRLQRIAEMVGVPEISVRVSAMAADFALNRGDVPAATAQLERLGDLDRVTDTLALLVGARLYGADVADQRNLLERAVAGAISPSERAHAELELVHHLLGTDMRSRALELLNELIERARGDADQEIARAEALAIRWDLCRDEADCAEAKSALAALGDLRHRAALTMLLINHGDYREATRVVAELDQDAEVTIMLRAELTRRVGNEDRVKELLADSGDTA